MSTIILLAVIAYLFWIFCGRTISMQKKFRNGAARFTLPQGISQDELIQRLRNDFQYPGLKNVSYDQNGKFSVVGRYGEYTVVTENNGLSVEPVSSKSRNKKTRLCEEAICICSYIRKLFDSGAPVNPYKQYQKMCHVKRNRIFTGVVLVLFCLGQTDTGTENVPAADTQSASTEAESVSAVDTQNASTEAENIPVNTEDTSTETKSVSVNMEENQTQTATPVTPTDTLEETIPEQSVLENYLGDWIVDNYSGDSPERVSFSIQNTDGIYYFQGVASWKVQIPATVLKVTHNDANGALASGTYTDNRGNTGQITFHMPPSEKPYLTVTVDNSTDRGMTLSYEACSRVTQEYAEFPDGEDIPDYEDTESADPSEQNPEIADVEMDEAAYVGMFLKFQSIIGEYDSQTSMEKCEELLPEIEQAIDIFVATKPPASCREGHEQLSMGFKQLKKIYQIRMQILKSTSNLEKQELLQQMQEYADSSKQYINNGMELLKGIINGVTAEVFLEQYYSSYGSGN